MMKSIRLDSYLKFGIRDSGTIFDKVEEKVICCDNVLVFISQNNFKKTVLPGDGILDILRNAELVHFFNGIFVLHIFCENNLLRKVGVRCLVTFQN